MFVAKDNARLRRLFLKAGAGQIVGTDIAPGAVGTTNLAPGSVTSAILAPGAAATPAQGALADTALQNAAAFATAAQGALAATAYGWGNHAAAGYQTALGYGLYEQQAASGSDGGALASGAWTIRPLTATIVAMSGATLAAGAVTVPAGTYLVFGEAPASGVGAHRVALFAGGVAHTHGTNARSPAAVDIQTLSALTAIVVGPAVLDLRSWVGTAVGTTDGGLPVTTGDLERYARLLLVKVA